MTGRSANFLTVPREATTLKVWTGGCNSLIHPTEISPREYAWGENIVNRGGIVQNRPGFKLKASIAGTRVQGFCIFTPRSSTARLVVAVDGKIYQAAYPRYEFIQIAGLQFSATAEFIVFQPATKSVKRNPDGSLTIITPTPVLMIQDGENRCGYWDGATAKHLNPDAPDLGTPIGLWMAWTSSRLWVMKGRRIYASDIADPLTFSENTYLAERSNFDLPDDGTGLIETADQTGLLAFTARTTTALKSYIFDRTQWATTPDFQKLIVPGVGNVAPRSARNQYGETYWQSERGFVSLNAALYTQRNNHLETLDGAMMRSKRNLSARLTAACACAFENYFLVSVPSGSKHNAQTWALDQSPMDGAPPSWNGVWSGVRPIEWAVGHVGGRERCFFASYDATPVNDTHIHIWEAFSSDREDEGKLTCQFETGIITYEAKQLFKYAEIEVTELLGDVNLKVYVGATRGPWYLICDTDLSAEIGSIGGVYQSIIDLNTILEAYKPQSRTVKTKEFTPDSESCPPEFSGDSANADKGFSILCEWRGRMGVREIRAVFGDTPQNMLGACAGTEAGEINAVTDTGERALP